MCWRLLAACRHVLQLNGVKGDKMNNNKLTSKYSLGDQGGEQLIRATLVCELMADLMSHQGSSNQKMVSALGVSALFECLAGQLDGVLDNSILLSVTKIKGEDNAIN